MDSPSKNNTPTKLDIEMSMLKTLSDIVKTLKKGDIFVYNLALVSINSNIAEYLLDLLLKVFYEEIEMAIENKELKIDFRNFSTEGMSRQDRIKLLKIFNFPNKEKVSQLFGEIFSHRDNIMHKMITAHYKGIDIDNSIKIVSQKTDELRTVVANLLSEVWSNPPIVGIQ
jgi:hypothetical protein